MPYVTVSSELVSSLVAATTVTRDDLNGIRDPRQPHRFSGVYGHIHGGRPGRCYVRPTVYRARVFKFFELGSGFDSPEAAARAVVAFYKRHFGERWRRAFRYRKVTPWRLRCVERPTAAGYAVDVYVRGVPKRVTHADVAGRASGARECDLFPTPEAAKRAARVAMARWFEREKGLLPIPATGLLFWRG